MNLGFLGIAGKEAKTRYVPIDGWIPQRGEWNYVSADAPSYVINIPDRDAILINPGTRLRIYQGGTVEYFLVTVVGTSAAGISAVTIYGGTDYSLTASGLQNCSFSPIKAPYGFPLSDAKWTVTTSDTSNAAQASPTASTWYNLGSISITIPIGVWNVYYQVINELTVTEVAIVSLAMRATLSTANNTESDNTNTSSQGATVPIVTGGILRFNQVITAKVFTLTSKTQYYLNSFWGATGATSLNFRGDLAPTVIKAVSVYL